MGCQQNYSTFVCLPKQVWRGSLSPKWEDCGERGKLTDDLNGTSLHNGPSHHHLVNQKTANHLSMNHNLQNHHHHAVAALSSPFSSLLGAAAGGGAAGYLLDPLGGLNKTTAANHLF
ncbi:paired box protein [Anopheles sinensis]|uniref:Paired box protein n=1 Tax=Anopheles sinensis TaxID=74873 RepID=A0A084WHT9_ANOSI|nr:paired box protein [Anopheles sinensis]